MRPILSIVIPNYNYGRYLESAIQSILTQGGGDRVELIICDGASTDNSVEIIHKYADHISWWCSEKDGGQSAAFNKGFSHARGEWLTWLNADDVMLPGAISAFLDLVRRRPTAEWITGNKLSFDSITERIVTVNWGPHIQPPLLRGRRAFSAVFGPTTFFRKSLYDRLGPIDEKLHYAMDTEYWARLTMAGVKQIRLNQLCWGFRIHETSKTTGFQSKEVRQKRTKETQYWRDKTGYDFRVSFNNVNYIAWILWRLIDGSWIKRLALKLRLEGKSLDCLVEKRCNNG